MEGIVLSTLFLKQHDIADEIAGIALAWGIGRPLFNHYWGSLEPKKSMQRMKKNAA